MNLKKLVLVLCMICALSVSTTVMASPINALVFSNNPAFNSGGSALFTSAGGSITNAAIDQVVNLNTFLGGQLNGTCGASGTAACLSITTGSLISSTSTQRTYAPGTLSIFGMFGINPSATLFATTFASNVVVQMNMPSRTGTVQGTLSPGTLDPVLAAFLGVMNSTVGGTNNNSIFRLAVNLTNGNVGGTISTSAVQADALSTVPEPGSMMLLGTGLLSLGAYVKRRRKSA